jgi:uncharacterized protein involved in outer membrane biogenesis
MSATLRLPSERARIENIRNARTMPRQSIRPLKILGLVVAGVAVLAIVSAAVLLATFDPNQYKGYVTRWAEQRTGRSLSIDGDLRLKLFPWLAIETGGIEVGNAPGFGAAPFATIERASAEVKLWPLLAKRIEVGSVDIDGLHLDLAVDGNGRTNWDDLLERDAGAAASPGGADRAGGADGAGSESTTAGADAGGATRDGAPAPGWLDALDIAGVAVDDSTVRWSDPSGLRYEIAVKSLASTAIRAGQPTHVKADLDIRDARSGRTYGITTQTAATLGASDVELRDTTADLELASAGSVIGTGRFTAASIDVLRDGSLRLGATNLLAKIAGDRSLDLGAAWSTASYEPAAGTARIENLSTRVNGIDAAWQLDIDGLPSAAVIEGSAQVAAAAAASMLELLDLAPPPGVAPADLGAVDLAARFRAKLAATTNPAGDAAAAAPPFALESLEIEKIDGAWRAMKLTGSASLTAGAASTGARRLSANIEIPAFTADDTLRKIVAANLPAGLDAAALQRVAFSGRIEADLDGSRFALSDARAELLGATLTGNIEAVPQGKGRLYRGAIKAPRFPPEAFAKFLGKTLSPKIAPTELGMLSLDMGFSYDAAADSAMIEPLTFEAFGLSASGKVAAANVTGTPVLEGDARVPSFSPRDLLRRFGQPAPATSDPKTLQSASIATHFRIDGGRGRFTAMTLALDDSRITGDFTVAGVRNPDYRFALAIDHIDVDRYLPPPSSKAQAGAPTAGDIELPAEALGNLKLDGTIKVGRLELANLDLDEVSTAIAVGNGEAHLTNAGAKLYGGRFDGAFDVKAAGEQPGLTLTGKAQSLDLGALIAALTRSPANVSGKGDFDLSLSGRGATVIDNVKTAGGRVAFSMKDGAIAGFNLGRSLCSVYNSLQKVPGPADRPKVTSYEVISGTADVANGVASSKDLLARASFMDVTGKGQLDLAAQRLDYGVEAKLTGKIDIPGCESMEGLIGESIPLTLRGTLTDPSISPDFSAIIQRRLKNEVKERLQERLLKGLLK